MYSVLVYVIHSVLYDVMLWVMVSVVQSGYAMGLYYVLLRTDFGGNHPLPYNGFKEHLTKDISHI